MNLNKQILLLEKLSNKKVILIEKWVEIESTNISKVDYNKQTADLKIKFLSYPKSIYIFKRVPFDVYKGLMDNKSKGKFFHDKIKNKFEFIMN